MLPRPDFAAHRRAVLDRLAEDEAVLLFGSPRRTRSADSEYRYRPDSDVYWLTGWPDPGVALFLRPGAEPLTLFVQPRDEHSEAWTGARPGPEGARARFGADVAHDIGELGEHLPRLLQGVSTLHYAFGRDPDHDGLLLGAIEQARRQARRNGLAVPETFHSLSRLIHELRLVKGDDEVAVLREAARVTGIGLGAAMACARPGLHEYQLEALVDGTFRAHGATGPAFCTTVGGGANATVLHYQANEAVLRDGDLVLIDAGAEVGCYAADVTRTFPVGGRFSGPQRRVYGWVLRAQRAAIEAMRVGRSWLDVDDAAARVLAEAMVDLGLLGGAVDDLLADRAHLRYARHGVGHWLGVDVHDVGAYARDGSSRQLVPGIVMTVEPGIYVPDDDDDAPEPLRGIGVRIEDDVLVTPDDPEVLTASIPRTPDQIEAACQVDPGEVDCLYPSPRTGSTL